MKLTDNEKALVKALVDYEAHVNEATQYLKETYNIDAEFNIDDMKKKLSLLLIAIPLLCYCDSKKDGRYSYEELWQSNQYPSALAQATYAL